MRCAGYTLPQYRRLTPQTLGGVGLGRLERSCKRELVAVGELVAGDLASARDAIALVGN